MHGLLMGLPIEHLKGLDRNEKLPIKMLIEINRGRKIYNWEAYAKAFGYITISKIRNIENISKYITKYITKELANTRISLNNHLYYCSKGLNRAKIICQGQLRQELDEDYSNEYVKIKTVHTLEEATKYFHDEKEENDRR